MDWWSRILSRDGAADTFEVRSRKTVLFASLTMTIYAVLCVLLALFRPVHIGLCAGFLLGVTGTITIVWGACKRRFTQSFLIPVLCAIAVSICMGDIYFYQADLQVAWPDFVAIVDLILVLRLDHRFATGVVCCVVLWLLVTLAERVFRFGIYDVPLTYRYEVRKERLSKSLNCDKPPCAIEFTDVVSYQLVGIGVFVIDFIATRGFAEEVEKEQASMARTIETVEAAAQLLAGYDVDTVAELLEAAEGRLPPAMHAALQRLEHNLRLYRPYLPVALFERVSIDNEGRRSVLPVAAPGSESGEATLVFTDIRASTCVWEVAPEAMQKAIRTHNAVMREAVSRFSGYEVKTIGDAFMVAFEEPCAGVCFGLSVQEALLAAEWPAALLEVPICRRTGLWGGLTVRVGVNHGPVMAETNALTGRVDYLGHTVNVASRLESTCVPGAVAVPSAVWSQVSGACAPAVAGNELATELKGVSEALPMRHVWPAALAARQHEPLGCTEVQCGSVRTHRVSVDSDSTCMSVLSSATASLKSLLSRRDLLAMQRKHATLGIVSLKTVQDVTDTLLINDCLEAAVPLLHQSHGTLVSLLGERLLTGWNLVQPLPVHAENAVQFVRRALRVPLCERLTAGLASGTVYHGDVGTRSQRFVTVAGPGVAAGLQVWHTACDAGRRFLYTPGEGAVLVGALQAVLQPTTLVTQKTSSSDTLPDLYELQDEARGNECDNKVSKVQLG